MTIDDFRTNSELVKGAREILAHPALRAMLETLRENGPEFRLQPIGLNPTDAATRLGHVCGYAEFYKNLQLLGSYARPADQLEATYEDAVTEESDT